MIFLELFLTFFKIGAFTFGGGYAMLPLIQSEAIGNGWMTMEEIIDFIAVSESTPGPFAINMATFVGTQMGKEFLGVGGGILGAICATLGVVMPSFIVILFVAKFLIFLDFHPQFTLCYEQEGRELVQFYQCEGRRTILLRSRPGTAPHR